MAHPVSCHAEISRPFGLTVSDVTPDAMYLDQGAVVFGYILDRVLIFDAPILPNPNNTQTTFSSQQLGCMAFLW